MEFSLVLVLRIEMIKSSRLHDITIQKTVIILQLNNKLRMKWNESVVT
jgi:hypothetical protein